ncbi:hypothetical protein BDR26DRAFT_855080 [Obelidium mucronatum]|nr:hypothetical protein BDR26DRAFT_855080 [Obelidium mucronatum]
MQWRSASGQNSAETAIRENSFNEQEDAFDDQDEGDDGGDDVLVEPTDNSISSRTSAFLPHRSTKSMGLEPIQIFVVDTDAEQAAKTRKLGSDLRFKEASLSETMSAYLDSSFSHGLSSRSQSPYKNKPELTQYVRPSAFEIAREGWLFHHLTTENDNDHNWEKSFTIATYQQISKTGILQLYESDSDIHPFRVLDLTQLDSILPTLRPTIAYLNPMADPLTLYSFTLVIGSKNVVLYCVSLAERDAWIITNSDILETKESTTTILPSTSDTAVPSEIHSTRTTEAQEEKVAEGGGTLADKLTESMEMRTSRIGKMVHDLVGGQKGIAEDVKLLLSRSSGEGTVQSGIQSSSIEGLEEGQKAISCDIGSLLAIAAEGNMSQRVGWESMDEKISEMSRQIQAMNMRDVEQRILDADNIAEVIDFVNKSQCRLVSLITDNCKLSPSPSPSRSAHHSSKDLNYARIIESIQDTITELLEPFLQQQQQLHDHLTRTARESASRQDLLEVWMQRNQESLKQIQQTVSSVEKIERSLSPVKQYPNNNNASTLMHGFMKELERRAAGVVEDLVVDLKESEDMESLLEEKSKLLVDVSGLRNVKRELEEDFFECVRPLGDAVVELEKDLLNEWMAF